MALGLEEFVQSLVRHITGESAPVVGFGWNPPPALGPSPLHVPPPLNFSLSWRPGPGMFPPGPSTRGSLPGTRPSLGTILPWILSIIRRPTAPGQRPMTGEPAPIEPMPGMGSNPPSLGPRRPFPILPLVPVRTPSLGYSSSGISVAFGPRSPISQGSSPSGSSPGLSTLAGSAQEPRAGMEPWLPRPGGEQAGPVQGLTPSPGYIPVPIISPSEGLIPLPGLVTLPGPVQEPVPSLGPRTPPTLPLPSPTLSPGLGALTGPAQGETASIEPWLSSILTPAAQALAVLAAAIPPLAPFLQAAAPVTWSLAQSMPGIAELIQLTPEMIAQIIQLLQPTPGPGGPQQPAPGPGGPQQPAPGPGEPREPPEPREPTTQPTQPTPGPSRPQRSSQPIPRGEFYGHEE